MSAPRLLDTSAISLYLAPRAVEKTPRLVNTLDDARPYFYTFKRVLIWAAR